MTPTFKGLGSALAKLKHNLDLQSAPLMADIEELANTAPQLLKQAQQEVAKTKQAVSDIKDFVEGLTGTNGAPSSDGSSTSSETSGTATTQTNDGAGAASAATEQRLTVNGAQA